MSRDRRHRWFRFRDSRDIDRDLDDELEFHLERTVDELVAQGWSLPDAEREAYRRFGDVSDYRKRIRRLDEGRMTVERRREWFGNVVRDLRHAVRSLRREPLLTVGIALTLALGIGANTTMFGIVDRLLLSAPEHVREPERLRRLVIDAQWRGQQYLQPTFTYADYRDLARVDGFARVGAYGDDQVTLGFGESARRIDAVMATASLIDMLGPVAARGRFFSSREDRIGGPAVAVLGWEFWRSQYGADPGIVGDTVRIGEVEYSVIGVAPEGFTGVDLTRVDVWLPLHVAADHLMPNVDLTGASDDDWQVWWLTVVARLAPGVAEEAAVEEATAVHLAGRADEDYEGRLVAAPIIAGRGPLASDESKVSIWLTGVSLVVLLVACANVTNMLLARGLRRRGEIAVRMALGIQRSRLIRQLLTESVVLALLGGGAALVVAQLGGGLLRRVLLPNVVWASGVMAPGELAFTFVVAVVVGLAAGLLPALQWSRGNVIDDLRDAGRGAAGRSRLRSGLLVAQAALSVVLLIGAGLFVRSLQEVGSLDMGLDDPASLLLVTPERSTTARQDDAFTWPVRDILARMRAHPGVVDATASITVPFGGSWALSLSLPGRDSEELPRLETGGPYIHPVADDYFETLGLEILRGRSISEVDRGGTERVAVVNETMASLYWPDGDALGECIRIGRPKQEGQEVPCTTVVGVVEDARRQDIDEGDTAQYYVPLEQHRLEEYVTFLVRARPGATQESVARDLRGQLLEMAPTVTRHVGVQVLQDRIDPQARAWRLGATMFTLFGALAVLVAAIGLYGVLAFDVARRTREIGVRAALGATRGSLRALVVRKGLRLTALGTGIGAIVALLAGPWLEELLFRVSPRDPGVFVAVAAALLAVAGAASWWPAVRATRVDPNEALRTE